MNCCFGAKKTYKESKQNTEKNKKEGQREAEESY